VYERSDRLGCEHVFVRRCGRCEELLPTESFARRGAGRQHWCKACFRAYFAARGDVHRRQSGAALERRRERAAAHVLAIVGAGACADCGERDPVVLEFDHVGPKRADVGQLVRDGVTVARLDDEIARCELVCACCHRRRTAVRRGSWRVRPPDAAHRRHAQLALVRERLRSGCVDCGRADLAVLEFDHVGPKRTSVMVMVWAGFALATIERELAACVVRCSNCHRRRTAAAGMHYRHSATMRDTPP
jgi:hypothetical protein